MPDRRLEVVFLVTREVDALVRFYRDTVGLPVTRYAESESAWFDAGDVQLAIHRPETRKGDADYTPEAETILWFRPTEGVRQAAKSIEREGVTLMRPDPAENFVYFKDPEGRVLGFHDPA